MALDDDELRAILAPFFKDGQALIDVAVLGCTHFPLLKSDLQRAVPSKIQWLDSGEAVARRLAGVLPDVGADRVSLEDVAICTSTQNEMASLARSFNHFGFARLEVLACD